MAFSGTMKVFRLLLKLVLAVTEKVETALMHFFHLLSEEEVHSLRM